jgi:uncharacterized protein (TIGR02453 family)
VSGPPFKGFPPEALTFYEGLEADNSKAYWVAHKDVYERAVRGPMEALCATVDPRFQPLKLFRPYRDVRFAKDKTPYKTACGAYGETEGGAGYYVALSSAGLMAGSGYYDMAADQLARFREAVAADATGRALVAAIAEVEKAGCAVSAMSALKTAPKGYPKDHPRVDILRRKGLAVSRRWPVARWLHTAAAKDRVEQAWAAADPVNRWLDAHVGPSELAPDERDVR